MLKIFLKILKIEVKLIKLSELNIQGKKSELILNLCSKLKAKKFIFGEQGINYADIDSFKEKKIDTIFQNYKHPSYKQLHGKFVPYLSIIDLLFNCGNRSMEIINSYKLLK